MKTLWGFEPYGQTRIAIKGMYKLLQQFSKNPKNLEIGYITTGNETILHTAFDVPVTERFTTYPKKLIISDLRNAAVSINEKNIHVIHYPTLSTTKAVDRLLTLGKSRGTEILAAFSHNKSGLERFLMGSFAETAVHRSKINLLIVNPKNKFKPIRNILFASDFSARSKRDLKKVLHLCKQLGARLTVFHSTEIIYTFDPTNPMVSSYRKKTKRMEEWIKNTCASAQVKCDVILRSELMPAADLALATAKKNKADLLVVTAKTGPLAALMGGSVTRDLVRNGTYPVLVLKR